MAETHRFRSAFRGFNREDVVHYIEYINSKHTAQVNQLNSEIAFLRQQLERVPAEAPAEAVVAEPAPAVQSCTEAELEAYRRAERTERIAKERAEQIYAQANGVLAEATLKAESASAHIGAIADQVSNQLKEYQDSVLETKTTFQEAVATLYAIKPQVEE